MDHPVPTDHRHTAGVHEAEANARSALATLLSFAVGQRAGLLADRLIDEHGSVGAVLSIVADSRVASLLGSPRACDILAAARQLARSSLRADFARAPLAQARAVIDYLRITMGFSGQEHIRVLYLDARHELLLEEVASEGSAIRTLLPIRDILRKAITLNAAGFLVAHNHPSGNPAPSDRDRIATDKLAAAAATLDLTLYDHLIVARSGWTSFKALGFLGSSAAGDMSDVYIGNESRGARDGSTNG